ncbi:MAG: phage Gp37/Gp68 family protein [Myxococcota bacterium]
MSHGSNIEWTDATWNPTTGCDRISRGCDNCYALALAARLKAMGVGKYQRDGNPKTSGPGFGLTVHESALDIPRRWRKPRRIFVNSMSDLFHAKVPVSFVESVFSVIQETPQHQYQLLTKRPLRALRLAHRLPWPDNLWLGTSVEDDSVLARVDHLRQTPAKVRFLSCEPLLGSINQLRLDRIDWVIVGGESGPNHRPVLLDWIREVRDLCIAEDVPFFFKQWGGRTSKAGGRELDGRTWEDWPAASSDSEGQRRNGIECYAS